MEYHSELFTRNQEKITGIISGKKVTRSEQFYIFRYFSPSIESRIILERNMGERYNSLWNLSLSLARFCATPRGSTTVWFAVSWCTIDHEDRGRCSNGYNNNRLTRAARVQVGTLGEAHTVHVGSRATNG